MPAATLTAPKLITPEIRARAIEQYSHANLYLLIRLPFWASLLGHARVFLSYAVKTACVDRKDRIFINPDFFDKIGAAGPAHRAFLLAHEIAHPALGIFMRMGNRDRELTNIAHDHVINLMLTQDDPKWFIQGGLCDSRFSGMSFEEVYDLIASEAEKQGGAGSSGEQTGIEIDIQPDGPEGEPSEEDAIGGNPDVPAKGREATEGLDQDKASRDTWTSRVIEAMLNARAAGKLGAGASRLADLSTAPVIDWRHLLRSRLDEVIRRSRLDWGSPNRRYCSTGIYGPREEGIGLDCALYIDTSGSISKGMLENAVGLIVRAMSLSRGRVRLLQGDAEITSDTVIRSAQLPELKGGGGTSFVPVIEHLRHDRKVKMLCIVTDTWGEMPATPPRFPVFWIVHESAINAASVPFGTIIPLPGS